MIWFVVGLLFSFLESKHHLKVLLLLLIALSFSYLTVERGVKNLVHRPRPEIYLAKALVVSDDSHTFSFPSGHSTIAFAAAYILGKLHKKWRWSVYILAILIAFSRIYLGKHYPSDVLVGSMIGLFIGWFSLFIVKKLPKLRLQLFK